ncbi:hypothetical protein OBV_04080 [Oscillibacter valericigenes Sjm18-20]|nr:hypothetical protein OBV_04080 [Oscillibacter valericigenes Sjm18-20]
MLRPKYFRKKSCLSGLPFFIASNGLESDIAFTPPVIRRDRTEITALPGPLSIAIFYLL